MVLHDLASCPNSHDSFTKSHSLRIAEPEAIHGNEEPLGQWELTPASEAWDLHHICRHGFNRGISVRTLCDVHIPATFSINESILFVVMVAVGGMMNVWGAVVGTIIMTILPESLRAFHDYDILMYGLVLLIIMMFMQRHCRLASGVCEAWNAGKDR